jgi:hypothetical protein
MIEKGSFVRIRQTLLKPEDRSKNIPEDTRNVPYKMWVKGYLQEAADLFDMVTVKTVTGRYVKGRLKEANPPYKHTYGDFVPEILCLRETILSDVRGEENE